MSGAEGSEERAGDPERGPGSRRLATWLRGRRAAAASDPGAGAASDPRAGAVPDPARGDGPHASPPPSSPLRPQPEDDASVYPLF